MTEMYINGLILPLDSNLERQYRIKNYIRIDDFAYVHYTISRIVYGTINRLTLEHFTEMSWDDKLNIILRNIQCTQCGKKLSEYITKDNHIFCNEECYQNFHLSGEEYIKFARCLQEDNPILFKKYNNLYKSMNYILE